jgi:hypothetical protein
MRRIVLFLCIVLNLEIFAADEDCPTALVSRLRRKIAFRMSVVSPSVAQAINQASVLLGMNMQVPSFSTSFPILNKIGRVLSRWPMAYLASELECKYNEKGVVLSLTYQRTPKIPYAGRILWSLWFINHKVNMLLGASSDGVLQVDLDENFFGVKVKSSSSSDRIEAAIRSNLSMYEQQVDALSSLVPVDINIPFISSLTTKIKSVIDRVSAKLTLAKSSATRSAENHFSALITKMLYMIPPFMRIIPLKQSVFIAWQGGNIKNFNDKSWNGQNLLIAPYVGKGSGDWHEWLASFVNYDYTESPWSDSTSQEYLEKANRF